MGEVVEHSTQYLSDTDLHAIATYLKSLFQMFNGDAFRAAHGEIFATFSKIQPYLGELRTASAEPEFCHHMETVVMAAPHAEAIITRRREAIRAGVKARARQQTQSAS